MNQSVLSNANKTNPSRSPLEPNFPQWIGFLALETVFLVLGTYLLTSVTYFTIKRYVSEVGNLRRYTFE